MKSSVTIFDIAAFSVALLLSGCRPSGHSISEKPSSGSVGTTDERGFNPLELPQDKIIVPKEHPQKGALGVNRDLVVDSSADSFSIDTTRRVPPITVDTLRNQVYRVQLATTRLFGEARDFVTVAEEIFDMPVYIDYEVPNFKIRVGSFADRSQAERYREKCRSSGYENAWVVMVSLNVKSLEPLYQDLPYMAPHDTLDADSTEDEH